VAKLRFADWGERDSGDGYRASSADSISISPPPSFTDT
jgi:hypothetical protein